MDHLYEGETPHEGDLACRILALEAVLKRCLLEQAIYEKFVPMKVMEWTDDYRALGDWVRNRMQPRFTRLELAVIFRPLGQLEVSQEAYDFNWQALMALRWAGQIDPDLKRLPGCLAQDPPIGVQAEANASEAIACFPDEGAIACLYMLSMPRPAEELRKAREETWEALFKLLLGAAQSVNRDLLGWDAGIQNDLSSRRPLRRAYCRIIGQLTALDWLLGIRPDWDEPYFAGYRKAGFRHPRIFLE